MLDGEETAVYFTDPNNPDTDGDGFYDKEDGDPLNPEDFDGFEDDDGIPDYEFTSVSGHLRVCGQTLSIYDIVVEGEAQDNVVAKFDSMASLSASNHLSTDAPISAENVEKVKIMIRLIEQLMEE